MIFFSWKTFREKKFSSLLIVSSFSVYVWDGGRGDAKEKVNDFRLVLLCV